MTFLVICTCLGLVQLCKCRRLPRKVESELQDPCGLEKFGNRSNVQQLDTENNLTDEENIPNLLERMTQRTKYLLKSYVSKYSVLNLKQNKFICICLKSEDSFSWLIYKCLCMYVKIDFFLSQEKP